MTKEMIYTTPANAGVVSSLLKQAFITEGGTSFLRVAGNAYHFVDRVGERPLSLKQRLLIETIKKNPYFSFHRWQVSELRYLIINQEKMVVSAVISDVVMAVHPLNMPLGGIEEFGLTEGQGFGLLKTVLEFPNQDFGHGSANGFVVKR